ncbi:MAG: anthranilate phosphoribosyltransferase [Planctomycetota bacterium]
MKRETQTPSVSRESPEVNLQPVLSRLVEGDQLTERETYEVFSAIMTGRVHDLHIAALLAILQHRGAVVSELTGAARVMRDHVSSVRLPEDIDPTRVVDTCGTGGAPKTFNVSTLAAIVVAAAGGVVPKHGNRSRTGRGSAEILERLGVNVNAGPDVQEACLREAGVCFSYAIHHHPAIRHVMPVRRTLGIPSIYNLLGPLTNPAGARRQLIGVYAPRLTELLAEALANLKTERALVVHGHDGLDEFTITAPTRVSEVRSGVVTTRTIDAADLGMERASLEDLQVQSLDEAANVAREVLEGRPGPKRDMVALNAGAACYLIGLRETLAESVAAVSEILNQGGAMATLEKLIKVSNQS